MEKKFMQLILDINSLNKYMTRFDSSNEIIQLSVLYPDLFSYLPIGIQILSPNFLEKDFSYSIQTSHANLVPTSVQYLQNVVLSFEKG